MLEDGTTAMCSIVLSASLVTTAATVKDATAIAVITSVVQAVIIAVLDMDIMESTEIIGMELELELTLELELELELKVMGLWVNL